MNNIYRPRKKTSPVLLGSMLLLSNTAFAFTEFNLSDLNGQNGFVTNGIFPGDLSGYTVSGAGDINGDGLDDLIVGSDGASHVVYGSQAGFSASLDFSDLDGQNGFAINGAGVAVSGAGDVNGDGVDDLIVGTLDTQDYVIFGQQAGFSASLDVADLDGLNGYSISGIDAGAWSVTGAGDLNGDGLADVAIGTQFGDGYLVFGQAGGLGADIDLATLDGTNGVYISGMFSTDVPVSSVGDFNGDGFDDLVFGGADEELTSLIFGQATFAPVLDVFDLDGSNGFVLNGINAGDASGFSVSGAGDVNGDGLDDLIVGARAADANGLQDAGQSYLVFGQQTGFDPALNLSDLDGQNGFAINGISAGDSAGWSVSGAGDVNGDGLDDLLIGAQGADSNGQQGTGQTYLVFGQQAGFDASLNLSDLDGENGFVINGVNESEGSGFSVSAAGDIDGDGLGDLVIGAVSVVPTGQPGQSYVVLGTAFATVPVPSALYLFVSGLLLLFVRKNTLSK